MGELIEGQFEDAAGNWVQKVVEIDESCFKTRKYNEGRNHGQLCFFWCVCAYGEGYREMLYERSS